MLVAILFLLKADEETVKTRPPNTLYEVILTWKGESEDDLDLYVRAASGHIVSFNNREGGEGSLISLNHDALGKSRNNSLQSDIEGKIVGFNEEIVAFRGAVEGENIVNVHVYRKADEEPVEATLELIKIKPYKLIIIKKKILTTTGEEKTGFRFITDKNGEIIDVNELPATLIKPLGGEEENGE
jgi:hypothetical protein